jgi:hypothetical protein
VVNLPYWINVGPMLAWGVRRDMSDLFPRNFFFFNSVLRVLIEYVRPEEANFHIHRLIGNSRWLSANISLEDAITSAGSPVDWGKIPYLSLVTPTDPEIRLPFPGDVRLSNWRQSTVATCSISPEVGRKEWDGGWQFHRGNPCGKVADASSDFRLSNDGNLNTLRASHSKQILLCGNLFCPAMFNLLAQLLVVSMLRL